MEQRTANIIMVCKGHHNFGDKLTLKQAVAHYMAKTCAIPVECYADDILRGVVFEALMDFLSTCTQPRLTLQNIFEARYRRTLHKISEGHYWCDWAPRETVDDITAVLTGLLMCQVRDDNGDYINGFTEELINNPELLE